MLRVSVLVVSILVGVAYGFGTVFSLIALVPVSEGRPPAGPVSVVVVVNAFLAGCLFLLRRFTATLPDPTKFVVIGLILAIMLLANLWIGNYRDIVYMLLHGLVVSIPVWSIYKWTAVRNDLE